MRLRYLILTAALAAASVPAAQFLHEPSEVDALLRGATLHGIYLRTGAAYVLEFKADGALVRGGGGEGRWWVNDQGQYCREWTSGQLKGNQACLDLAREGEGVALYSTGRKVAEGKLSRP